MTKDVYEFVYAGKDNAVTILAHQMAYTIPHAAVTYDIDHWAVLCAMANAISIALLESEISEKEATDRINALHDVMIATYHHGKGKKDGAGHA